MIYTLSLHDALPISEQDGHGSLRSAEAAGGGHHQHHADLHAAAAGGERTGSPGAVQRGAAPRGIRPHRGDRKSTRLNSSHVSISYAVFCLKKKKKEK